MGKVPCKQVRLQSLSGRCRMSASAWEAHWGFTVSVLLETESWARRGMVSGHTDIRGPVASSSSVTQVRLRT